VELSGIYQPPIVPGPPRHLFARGGATGRVDLTRSGNTVEAATRGVAAFTLLVSPDQFDFAKPVKVIVNGRTVFTGNVAKNLATLLKFAAADNDRTMLFGPSSTSISCADDARRTSHVAPRTSHLRRTPHVAPRPSPPHSHLVRRTSHLARRTSHVAPPHLHRSSTVDHRHSPWSLPNRDLLDDLLRCQIDDRDVVRRAVGRIRRLAVRQQRDAPRR